MEWTDELSTSIEEIDLRQTELIRRVKLMLDAFVAEKGREEIGRFLAYLQDHVVTHFGTEEKYMIYRSYPGYEEHRKEHRLFIDALSRLRETFFKEGGSSQVVRESIWLASKWVAYHVRITDRSLGVFMKKQTVCGMRSLESVPLQCTRDQPIPAATGEEA